MGLSPLIYGPETYNKPKNTSFPYLSRYMMHIYVYKNNHRDVTLNKIFQNFCNNFLNSDFSLYDESNITKSIGYVLCIILEGRVSRNFDLGLGYFFILCRNFVIVFFHSFLCFMS